MSRWFRMYSDVLDDPKVQKLSPELFKAWVNILCLASRNNGILPNSEDMAFALRVDEGVCSIVVQQLVERGLLDAGDGLIPHNWNTRQFKSDGADDAKERKRKQRSRGTENDCHNEVTVNDCDSHSEVTPPEQSRADTKQSRTEQARSSSQEPAHMGEVAELLSDRSSDLTKWEQEFLKGIKFAASISAAQLDVFNGIKDKLKSTSNGGHAMSSVSRGTPQYDAWIAYYRQRGPATFYEKLDALTVPTEFPPHHQAA